MWLFPSHLASAAHAKDTQIADDSRGRKPRENNDSSLLTCFLLPLNSINVEKQNAELCDAENAENDEERNGRICCALRVHLGGFRLINGSTGFFFFGGCGPCHHQSVTVSSLLLSLHSPSVPQVPVAGAYWDHFAVQAPEAMALMAAPSPAPPWPMGPPVLLVLWDLSGPWRGRVALPVAGVSGELGVGISASFCELAVEGWVFRAYHILSLGRAVLRPQDGASWWWWWSGLWAVQHCAAPPDQPRLAH